MASASSSHSEGEIFTSDSEKATPTLPSHHDTSIDGRTRTNARAPRRSRSRSRSPYRVSRGEKRRRDSRDGTDPSRMNARSRHQRPDEGKYTSDRHHGRRSGADSDGHHMGRANRSRDYEDRYRSSKRVRTGPRSRSRSPFRHNASHSKSGLSDRSDHRVKSHRDDAAREDGYHRAELSVSERGKPSAATSTSRSNAELSDKQSPSVTSTKPGKLKSDENFLSPVHASEKTSSTGLPDEATLIEERRKRREALKARYRSQEPSLLVQALHVGTEASSPRPMNTALLEAAGHPQSTTVSTPKDGVSDFQSVEAASPQTSVDTPRSPAEIGFEQVESLANTNASSAAADEDGPSAADYDPTADMQEERTRHDKRLFKEDISLSVTNEKNSLGSGDAPPAGRDDTTSDQAVEPQDSFDMFAEVDDDVDMFAEAAPKRRPAADTKAGQKLDAKMMDNWDDPEGYYITIPGELFESRYHVLQNLGRGMFSSVVRATDTKSNKLVAIKIVRNNDTMRKAGAKEIDILKNLAANDPEDKKHLVRLERSFDHKGHLCMVFENLSLNLREVLKKFGRDIGINIKAIRAYAQQLFLGLSLMRKCQYLHADLKPDNILVNEARNLLKICDLGSASSIDENMTAPYLVSRFYRAPEVILGINYDYGIDMWSVGCTLFELYTGKILFTGRNNNAMLRSIMDCRGKIPPKLLRRGSLTPQYFDDLLNFQAVEEDKLTGRTFTKMVDIKAKPVRSLRERLMPRGKKMTEPEKMEVGLFADLLDKCLDLRVDKRITPIEALKHPFITRP